MLSQQIRRQFLQYFKDRGHTIVPSSPVIPHDDPTLLFINAGMNQFKDVFLGEAKRDYSKASTSQKCIRVGGKHNDLDNVGHTSRHLTFFEMLGNFSFGDYFKKEAIAYAWEVTEKIFGFDLSRVWVSVFEEDDEAFALWEKHIPSDRIVRFGEKENFWAMGDVGPCGPCSELLYDRGEKYNSAKTPLQDPSGERYLEFWNLVFMQMNREGPDKITPLRKKSIDTGAGLERVVSLKMGVEDVFHTDILRSLIAEVENLSQKSYHNQPAFHVIADHIRSLSFAIADGVQPSNTDRGYVLRKILRRAVRYGRTLGLNEPFLAKLTPRLVSLMGDDFQELKASKQRIEEILTVEEEAFFKTLKRGGQLLGEVIARSQKAKVISGDDAFKLKDTYGFPFEEVLLIAKDEELRVDIPRYENLLEEAKELSRKAHKVKASQFDANFFEQFSKTHPPCCFVGYEKGASEATVLGIVYEKGFVNELEEGQEGLILLDQTPFYAEMGGQVGDTGTIGELEVYDTTSPFPGVIAHLGSLKKGSLKVGERVFAQIDLKRRQKIQNNHTATHLLHWALQKVFGAHIKQAGSVVDEKRLRFDFSHHKAPSFEEIRQLERLVNEKIRENKQLSCYEISYEKAQTQSDIKQFFGDKYGEKVRVVDIDFSKELCGGTHTSSTGTIGLFKIIKESSIAAGIRRIEAVSAQEAENFVEEEEDLLKTVTQTLKASHQNVLEKLLALLEENKTLTQEIKAVKKEKLQSLKKELLEKKEKIGSISFIGKIVQIEPKELQSFALDILSQMDLGVVALGVVMEEKCQLVIALSSSIKQLNAVEMMKQVSSLIEGGGGGKPSLAQAGGKNPKGLHSALTKVRDLLQHAPL